MCTQGLQWVRKYTVTRSTGLKEKYLEYSTYAMTFFTLIKTDRIKHYLIYLKKGYLKYDLQ